MRKRSKYFFIACALLLLLGHSVLPHSHSDSTNTSPEINNQIELSLVEILKHSLANDLGADHFEEFQDGKGLNFQEIFNLDEVSPITVDFEEEYSNRILLEICIQPDRSRVLASDCTTKALLRAPPAIS